MEVDENFRNEFREALKELENGIRRLKVLKQILDAEVKEKTVRVAIGKIVVEGTDMREFGIDTFAEATAFTGVVFANYGTEWEVYYYRNGRRTKEERRTEDSVREEFEKAKEAGKVYVGKWWIAVENKLLGVL